MPGAGTGNEGWDVLLCGRGSPARVERGPNTAAEGDTAQGAERPWRPVEAAASRLPGVDRSFPVSLVTTALRQGL